MDAAERNRKGDRNMALSRAEMMANGIRRDNGEVAREGRLANHMESLNNELDWQHQARMRARTRRLESSLAAGADGGRYSPITMDRMKNELEYIRGGGITGLRQHELAMLKQQGENEFKVAKQKRFGMKEQGADAAGLNAEATKHGWDKQLEMEQVRQKGLTEREKATAESNEKTEGIRGTNALNVEKERQRGGLAIAQEQGDAAVDVEREKGLTAAAGAVRDEQVLKWKQQHEKELAQMRLNNMIPDEREMRGLIILQQQPENKGKSIMQILKEFRESNK